MTEFMGMLSRAKWSIGWLCPTILNVARWVQAFKSQQVLAADMLHSGQSLSVVTQTWQRP